MWIVRLVPTSPEGISRSWDRRSNPISSCPGTGMSYAVKEIFYTLQGEGAQTGRPAVFCRFSGCNLWSGREEDRGRAVCQFCDTDFVGTDGTGGGRFDTPDALATAVATTWPHHDQLPSHLWSALAANPSCSWTNLWSMLCIKWDLRLPSKPMGHRPQVRTSIGSASVPKHRRNSNSDPDTNSNLFSLKMVHRRNCTSTSIFSISFFNQWMVPRVKRTRRWRCATA